MSLFNNPLTLLAYRFVVGVGSVSRVYGADRLPKRHDGLLLACPHLSHYDPFVISTLLQRKVDWMARAEFYETAFSRFVVSRADAIRIDRAGPWLPGIREALRRLERGRLVGVFPEGEVSRDEASVLRGASIKQGVALLARYARVPVVPCVILNSDQFRAVMPWLPLRTGRLWLGFGEPLEADYSIPRGRASRRELTERLETAIRDLHAEMLAALDVAEQARARGIVLPAP